MSNIIFVGGIHGVGKSSLCKSISKRYKIASYSASGLIVNKKAVIFSKNKRVNDIEDNQKILIEALTQLAIKDNCFLLEGHFCLLNKDGKITRIPKETFIKLNLKAIIVLISPIMDILTRLKNRDEEFYDYTFLNNFQKAEIRYSREIADLLSIPYTIYDSTLSDNFLIEFLEGIISK